eukprot:SAG22_NODE_114_length_19318_cov_13.809980_2_plen_266_part_00
MAAAAAAAAPPPTAPWTPELERASQAVWDYHRLRMPLARADGKKWDGAICLCSSDLRVADHAAALLADEGLGLDWLVFSGGFGTGPHSGANLLGWTEPEAEVFAARARALGADPAKLLVEPEATNTGDNVAKSRALLAARGLAAERVLIVQKPFMERRSFATVAKVWPEVEIAVTAPDIPWHAYPAGAGGVGKDVIVNIMVGDLQRIDLYARPAWGFQTAQQTPPAVWAAYEQLVAAGYTWNLVELPEGEPPAGKLPVGPAPPNA